jgi:trigger factor
MEATLVEREAVSATVKVTVPATEVDAAFERVLQTLARQIKVPGFRPGKAPRGVLIRRIGEDALGEEVRDSLVDTNYPKAVQELDLAPVHAHFHAEPAVEGSDFEFEVHIDLYPDFELPDLAEIVIDTETPELTDEMVSDAVEQLQRENATLVPVERPTEAGDYLLLETLGDDEESAGTLPLDLETAQDHLVEQLLGKAMGDVVELTLADPSEADDEGAEDPPDDDGDEGDEGDAVAEASPPLRVRVADIKAKEKPEAGDDFAKTLGLDTWGEVEERIRESIGRQLDQRAFDEQVDEFVEKLMAEADFDLPASLVNRRKLDLIENLGEDLKRQERTLDEYLSSLDEQGERQRFDDDLERSARDGVRRDMLLERLLEHRGTDMSDEEFTDAVRHMASREGKDPQRFRRERGERWLTNYRFLLTRDRALRATVRELVGGEDATEPADGNGGAAEPDEAQG